MKNLVFICCMLLFAACSSPEADGKRAAAKFSVCDKKFIGKLDKITRKFINDFDNYNFTTRLEARQKSEELINSASHECQNCTQKAQQQYNRIKDKYVGSFGKIIKFEYAYNAKRIFDKQGITQGIPNQTEINNLILTIAQPKPDLEKIKQSLIGRKITEQPNGYHHKGWYWEIKDGEIKEIQIISENKQGDDYLFGVRLVLQADGSAHEALLNLTYVLRENDDWTIDFLESKQVNIVKTGKYDNCITAQRKGWSYEYELEFTNNCDVALVVGGIVLYESGNEWKKFSTIVNASETSSIGGLFLGSISDYKIHFVERP